MKIVDKSEYEFELDNAESEILKQAAGILAEITEQMSKRDCSMIIGGYEDCPYEYEYTSLVKGCLMLNEVAEAHTIC